MKRFSIIITLLGISLSLFAQPRGINRLYHTYSGEEGVISMTLPGFVLRFAANVGELEGPEEELLRSIRSMRILTIEDNDRYKNVNFAREVRFTPDDEYEMLLEVHEDDDDVLIMARRDGDVYRDLIIVVGGEDNVIVQMKGRANADLFEAIGGVAGVTSLSML
ncbi:MAG: DUF4252 domain-containing protein [Bacteroidota bacterium]